MNKYSPLIRQSLDELNIWLLEQPNLDREAARFYERIKNMLNEAFDSDPQHVSSTIETILHTLTDSGPDDVLTESFLPSFHKVASAVQSKKNS